MPPLPPKKGDSSKRAQQTKSRDISDLKPDPKQDLTTQVANDIPTNSTSSISSPTSQPDPRPKPFSNSERPKSYHVQDPVAVPDPAEALQLEKLQKQKLLEQYQQLLEQHQPPPSPQAAQEDKSKLLVPEPVVIVQPSSGMTLVMAAMGGKH